MFVYLMYPKILTILGGIMICIGHKTNISTLQYVSSMRLNISKYLLILWKVLWAG